MRRAIAELALALGLAGSSVAPASAASELDRGPTRDRARAVVCHVFGPYCGPALRVAWCESRFDVWARNGQYLALFQMGTRERARYGDGLCLWNQARAALRYFRASGSDWSPWTCKP